MNVRASHLWPGVPLALLSAALFGVSTPVAKLLLADVDPWMMAALLYLGAGVGLLVLLSIQRARARAAAQPPLRLSDVPVLLLVIATGGVLGPLLLMSGLARIDAAPASLLLNLESLATLAIAWVVFRENVDGRLFAGALAILSGALVLSWDGAGFGFDLGALLVAAACFAWAIDNNLTRKLSASDPVQIALIKGLVAGATNLALAFGRGAELPAINAVLAIGAVGFLGYGISLVLFIVALRHLGTARTGAYFALAPFIGAVVAIPLLGEPLTLTLVAAAILMAVGLWLHLAERHEHSHEHEPLEHEHAHSHDDRHHQHQHGPDDPPDEPHSHRHRHTRLVHSHPHYPDLHHRHDHAQIGPANRAAFNEGGAVDGHTPDAVIPGSPAVRRRPNRPA